MLNNSTFWYKIWFSALLLILAGCGVEAQRGEPTLFEHLPEEQTGVAFTNTVEDDTTLNIINYLYFYDGGGVAAGDVNGDDLVDLYFTASDGPNRLYMNRGNLRFEDVTEQAGVAGAGDWTKGTTMADVNGDGRLDIYVSNVSYLDRQGRNELFINNGDGTFTEQAATLGLDAEGYATQATFFDYDRDGDLDVFLLNHSVHAEDTFGRASLRTERNLRAGDRLLRNEDGRFVDVSEEAGIYGGVVGYGLGVAASDLDRDGWPDLYISNDFHENDYLYFNNGDGAFTEAVREAMPHVSYSAMGSDVADINNDGWPDVAVVDMLPADEATRKTTEGAEPYDIYNLKRDFGYHHQVVRNTLQLNRGGRRFSDIAYLAGIEATDWSWSALLADFDNDGFNDFFVTNGIPHRPNDLDYLNYVRTPGLQMALKRGLTTGELADLLSHMPEGAAPNFAFRNEGDLTFTDASAAWGLNETGFSNGAAYADLDNDGDLDLVVNNLNAPAAIYENHADSLLGHHYLTLRLEGEGANTMGVGATVLLKHGGETWLREQMPTRGWQSSVDPRLHIGLGEVATVDSLLVIWPDGRFQAMTNVATDQALVLRQTEASGSYAFSPAQPMRFEDITKQLSLDYTHRENAFVDFTRERLMPHLVSTEGPTLAVGDVNGDGLDDLFAGGAKWQPARLLVQQSNGLFSATNGALWQADSLYEDVDAAFFDAEGDGDLDLYVVSAGNEFWGEADALADRLYLNDGDGMLHCADGALPPIRENGCCVAPADFDGDGDTDLFVGSRVVSREYGSTPPSYLLENDGTGRFTDVTAERAPSLAEAGLVTDVAWTDADGDGALDLIVVSEWMPVRVFVQQDGRFTERTSAAGLDSTEGWWRSVLPADLDGDGDDDLVLGNLGLNAALRAMPDTPVRLYVSDFDGNGSTDHLMTFYRNGTAYPFASRDDVIQQMPSLAGRFARYADYGAIQPEALLSPEQRGAASVLEARTFASAVAMNAGDGTYTLHPLPATAQLTPLFATLADDLDGDGSLDLMLGGNFFGVTPTQGRYDAGYGLLLHGDGRGGFAPVDAVRDDLGLKGEVRRLAWLRRANGDRVLVAARNNAPLQLLRWIPPSADLAAAPR